MSIASEITTKTPLQPRSIMSLIRNLPVLVRERFKAARINGDLNFYETQVSILQCNGIPVKITLGPSHDVY